MDPFQQQQMPPQQQMGYMGGPGDFPPGVDQAEVDFLQAMGGAGGGDFHPGGGGGGGGDYFDEEMMN